MINVAWDTEIIQEWGLAAIECGLYRMDGIARRIFESRPELIEVMGYIPGVAWVIHTSLPRLYQGFTRPDLRRQGICARLTSAVAPGVFPLPQPSMLRDIVCNGHLETGTT